MTKIILLSVLSVLLSGCVVEPHVYAPSYPYGYVYNQPLAPYPPERPRWAPRAEPSEEQTERDANIARPDPAPGEADEVMRPLEPEEVIGGDDPPPDHPIRRSTRSSVERHRDHRGDYRP